MKILIVVDMQNDFIDGTLGTKEAQKIVPSVRKKIDEYVKSGDKIIFTRDTHGEDYLETNEGKNLPVKHCIKGTRGWNITAEFNGIENKYQIVDKITFGSDKLYTYVQKSNEIELVGLCTDICVISNAMILKAFLPEADITVDASCCAGVTPQSHMNALDAMKMCHIKVKEQGRVILDTERLYLREMTETDFPALCKILMDKDVMYAYEHAFDEKEARDWLENQFKRYKNDGFGLWAVVLKETGEMIGQCGLTKQDYNGVQVIEVGYLFQKAFWSKGYATEAAVACKKYAFEKLNEEEVYSIIRDNNISSQKVAVKNGMTKKDEFVKHYYGIDMPHFVFSERRNEN